MPIFTILEGLNDWARNLVKDAQAEEYIFTSRGMTFHLHKYILPDGRRLIEEVESTGWSIGFHYFTALKEDGKWIPESLWIKKAIEEKTDIAMITFPVSDVLKKKE